MPTAATREGVGRPFAVAAVALAFHVVLVASLLAQADGRIDSFVKFGAEGSNAALAERGASPWVGLVFALDPAVQVSVMYDLADALATAAIVAFVLLVRRERWAWAAVAATAAVLAKDTSILPVLAVVLFGVGGGWRRRATLLVPPVVVAGAWGVYERMRFGGGGVPDAFSIVPFGGFVDAWRHGWSPLGTYDDMVVALAVVALALFVVVRWWRRRSLELLACLPVALTVPFLSASVVNVNINAVRGLGPLVVLLVVDLFASRAEREAHAPLAAATG